MKLRPVVALDIDGTLGDYHGNWFTFARLYFNHPNSWDATEPNPGLPLWEHMGISQRAYREAKLAYRQGGWKRWMPAYEGVAGLTHQIRSAGAEVWICTTRPYLRLDTVDPDTREWLRRNNIQYDAVIFDPLEEGKTKYDELWYQGGERVAAIVDDLPEMIEAAKKAFPALRPILRSQPYNFQYATPRRVSDSTGMLQLIREDLAQWQATQQF